MSQSVFPRPNPRAAFPKIMISAVALSLFASVPSTLRGQGKVDVGAGGAGAVILPESNTVQGTLPANTSYGVIGTTSNIDFSTYSAGYNVGVLGTTSSASLNAYGVYGVSGSTGAGVFGISSNRGVEGHGFRGVFGITSSSSGSGIYGDGGGVGVGVIGSDATDGGLLIGIKTGLTALTGAGSVSFSLPSNTSVGVLANAGTNLDLSTFGNNQNIGLYAIAGTNQGRTATAAVFNGNVAVYGSLSKGGGSFKIDHPLDPEHKYLSHSFVESPDMKNVYDGIAVLDGSGQAVVQLPDWFEPLNSDFRYQLTAIGAPAPGLYVAQEVQHGRFVIAGGMAGQKVSWQLTGIRQDPWARKHRIVVEESKPEDQQGYYLYPDAYDLGNERSVDPVSRKAATKQH